MLPPKVEEKLLRRLEMIEALCFETVAEVPLEAVEVMEYFRTPPEELSHAPAPPGSCWGQHWGTTWFRGQLEVPKHCKGRRIYYRHVSFCDKLLWLDGAPFAGMNPKRPEVLVLRGARGGESLSLQVEAYTGHPIPGMSPYSQRVYTHQFCELDPGMEPPLRLEASEIVAEREQVTGLYFDAQVIYRTAMILEENSLRRVQLLEGLNRALDTLPLHDFPEGELEPAAKAARKLLAPLLNSKNAAGMPSAALTGHAHIDIGWLWPVRESIRKAAKTFSTVLNLMDAYPNLHFFQSQPWLYEMVEQHYPQLLPRIRKRVKEGRWEPNGGMWVEADCNLAGGEALVRQFLEGRKKMQALFGYRADTLWLPDVFGYSAALPQILRLCDIDHFVTSKINWNDTNRFPYDTFWWRGIDGSEIFTHFITTPTRLGGYNAQVLPETVQTAWNEVQRKDAQDSVLVSVGWGDGGGGPTREMCEYAARMGDLEGCPRTAFTPVSPYLKRLREDSAARPRWVGELYLEYHRATYTTQARTKRYNRKLEFLLRDVELFSVQAMDADFPYPAEALQQHWRTLLTNQFHDILPGTGIRSVYEVAEAEYAAMEESLQALLEGALRKLGTRIIADAEGGRVLVANSLNWPRHEVVYVDTEAHEGACDAQGNPLPCQRVGTQLAVQVYAQSLGVAPIALRAREHAGENPFSYSGKSLETPLYSVGFDSAGKILALYDKEARRELVREGRRLNDLFAAQDLPIFWDAWEIERYHRDTVQYEDRLVSREVVSEGPLLFKLRSVYAIGRHSQLTQDMVFHAESRRIDFVTAVDWRERQTLLKVGFGLDILADSFRGEIQFGHVTRPTHANTSWDQARFESCAHKWVDLSEGDYGVALLNDCKYGHDTLDDMISLTLLRSPLAPDAIADQGAHQFTYALLPHPGDFSAKTVAREAYALNVPLHVLRDASASEGTELGLEFCAVSNPNVVVEAVKRAESGEGLILRLYEAGKTRSQVTLRFARPVKRAAECNLLEEREEALAVKNEKITLRFRPFEIKTVKVLFA